MAHLYVACRMVDTPERWFAIQLCTISVPPEVVFRELARETVLLNVKTGQYHGVDPVGARFFGAMRDAANVAAACDRLAAEFEQPVGRIRADFVAFVGAMEERGLIRLGAPV